MGPRSFGQIAIIALAGALNGAEVPVERESRHYFARGFDLDEGGEFAYALDGIPLNVPSALQGPGFMDDGILIPEVCAEPVYRKGPYHVDQGPFAIAGGADLGTVAGFARPMARLDYGGAESDRFGRVLWAESPAPGASYALELTHSYRPWNQFWPSSKVNGFLRLAPAQPGQGWTFTGLATGERGDGGSPPPDRPLPANHEEDFDDLRLGNGYRFQRVFLGLSRPVDRGGGVTDTFRLHGGVSTLRNWVDPTYMLTGPRGDQKELVDRRAFAGFDARRQWDRRELAGGWVHVLGAQARVDAVTEAGVYATQRGERWRPLLQAQGELCHGALRGQSTRYWGQGWRAYAGARVDTQKNRVHGPMPAFRQDRLATLVSPRFGLGWQPWAGADLRCDLGQGLRLGNAFRDTRTMVRSRNAEVGAQFRLLGPWETGLTLWTLDLEHESLWDARVGAPLLRGSSRRQGLEWFNGFRRGPWHGEASLGWSRARFREAPAGQDRVPGSIPQTAVLAFGWDDGGLALGFTLKTLGAYTLTPDNAVLSGRRTALELSVSRTWRDWTAGLEVINAFNLNKNGKAYFYESQLPGEPWGLADSHTKHEDPQAIRLSITRRF